MNAVFAFITYNKNFVKRNLRYELQIYIVITSTKLQDSTRGIN